MEKIVYALSRKSSESTDVFARRLLSELAERFIGRHAVRLAVAVHDADVAPADRLRIIHRRPAIDAVVSLWVNSSNDHSRIETQLCDYAGTVEGYLVTESEVLQGPESGGPGERTPGMMQIAFLRIPEGLSHERWFSIWRDDHTQVAIQTQSTFVYRQNLVVRPLTVGATDCAAIVEEAFPVEAMTSQHAFYDAVGADDKL
ncbi:MAG: EthD domain-containing protein, partial [Gammaproteobacteria bacterium]|nr:EthD domain-containing protein [Gammaproteobacteria bacterium]